MYSPPAVSYLVGPSRFEFWLISSLLSLGVAVCAWWTQESDQFGWRQMTALMVWLFAAFTFYIRWKNSSAGHLVWRQEGWFWNPENGNKNREIQATDMVVHLDFQFTLLLKLSFSDRTYQWIWLEKKTQPERWLDVRRAVHGPRRVLE